MDMEESELIVGTYEDYVVGHQIVFSEPKGGQKKLKTNGTGPKKLSVSHHVYLDQSFAVRAHSGSVRALVSSANGSYVFSAGHDEMTNLFDLKRRKLLQTSEGAVNCATFVGNSHLICGSEDGNIYIHELKKSTLTKVKTLKGHDSGVISLDAHPSGKVLLSLSKDNTMRTWNLIKGRCAYVTNIKTHAHLVRWSRSGNEFLVVIKNEVYLYASTGSLIRSFKLDRRVNCAEFIGSGVLVVAKDSGELEFIYFQRDVPNLKLNAHETRIKSVACVYLGETSRGTDVDDDDNDTATASDAKTFLASASSDGVVKLWSICELEDGQQPPKELARVNLDARVTHMVAAVRKRST